MLVSAALVSPLLKGPDKHPAIVALHAGTVCWIYVSQSRNHHGGKAGPAVLELGTLDREEVVRRLGEGKADLQDAELRVAAEDLLQHLSSPTARRRTRKQRGPLGRVWRVVTTNLDLDAIVRRFTRRRQLLERRSATEELVTRYEGVSARLRRASVFTDELRLTALELQAEVQELHADIDKAQDDARTAARRVIALEQAIEQAASLPPAERDRVTDTLRFELRHEGQNLQLFKALGEMCGRHVEPARALRDTVQRLHEEMQSFVLAATGTVDAAGRRIQALGAAADAPVVAAVRSALDNQAEGKRCAARGDAAGAAAENGSAAAKAEEEKGMPDPGLEPQTSSTFANRPLTRSGPISGQMREELEKVRPGAAEVLQSLLEVMASWPETRRLGFYSAASVDQLNHPSQTLERVEEPLDQLRTGLIGVQGRLQEPTLVQWS